MFLSATATTDRMALSVSNECLCASQPSESRLDSFPPGPMKSLMENVAVASLAILSSPRHCPDESARRNSRTAEREFLPLQPCEPRHAGNKNETAAVQQGGGFGWAIYRRIVFSKRKNEGHNSGKGSLKTRSNRQLLHDEWMGNACSMGRLGNCVFQLETPRRKPRVSTMYRILHTMCFRRAWAFSWKLHQEIVDRVWMELTERYVAVVSLSISLLV